MGGRADLTTVPPLRAAQLAGTLQALDRTQGVAVNLGGRISELPRPNLLGTGGKACAEAGDHIRGPQRHLEDLARLYRLVADPAALSLTAKERKRLRDTAEPTRAVLNDSGERVAARAARRLITTPPA